MREVFGYGEASEGQDILAPGKGRGAGRGEVKIPPLMWHGKVCGSIWVYTGS